MSFPIPEPLADCANPTRYDEIRCPGGGTLADVMTQLGVSARVLADSAHLDPDLNDYARPRASGWRPAFGQSGPAASHLINQNVSRGDLFVFWGRFRHTEERSGQLRWRGQPFHAVFGWLWVGEIVRPSIDPTPPWMSDHPHVSAPDRPRNTVYVAADRDGAGTVPWNDRRRLTAPGATASRWRLPLECHPDRTGVELSYHKNRRRWSTDGDVLALECVGRGQEFVVDAHPAWRRWLSATLPEAVRQGS